MSIVEIQKRCGITVNKDSNRDSDETAAVSYDWMEVGTSIATFCNFCGEYDIKQVGYEWIQEQTQQSQQQSKQVWTSNDLEVELYRKFLFDESSVGGQE